MAVHNPAKISASFWRLPSATVAIVAIAGAVGGVALVSSNSDQLIDGRFRAALSAPANMTQGAALNGRAAIAGTEEFWLGRVMPAGAWPVVYAAPLAVGQHLSVGDGRTMRRLEVIDVRDAGAAVARELASSEGHLRVVTCRDIDHPERPAVRLLLDAGFAASGQAASAL